MSKDKTVIIDCGSSSCRYASKRGGQRVNGPCRCDRCPSCGKDIRLRVGTPLPKHFGHCKIQHWAPPSWSQQILMVARIIQQRDASDEGDETLRLLAEIEEWKDASGLERGGDPDGVTPDDLRDELAHLRATQEKSWSAADEALLAEHATEIARMVLVVRQYCGQCAIGDDPGACADCSLHSIGGGHNWRSK